MRNDDTITEDHDLKDTIKVEGSDLKDWIRLTISATTLKKRATIASG